MRNTKAGFSLVEIVVAIVLIAIAAVSALSFSVYCYRFALQADDRITAANFARATLESLYKRDYTDANLNAVTNQSDPFPAGTNFSSRYTITDKADYKLINATVTWNQ